MAPINRTICVICGFILAVGTARAQVATGTPPFGSFSGGPDVVNSADLNVQFAMGMVSKAGRGLPFGYVMTYQSSVWYPSGSGSVYAWTPVTNWGWRGIAEVAAGYISYQSSQARCHYGGGYSYYTLYINWQYHDPSGTFHSFPMVLTPGSTTCGLDPINSATAVASDGSGYTMTAKLPLSATVYSTSGTLVSAPLASPSGNSQVTDANGNSVSASVSSGTTTFTDTLNTTALTVSGSGTPSSPVTYTYTNPAGGQSSYTMNYNQYTVETNFACTNPAVTDFGQASQTTENLVSSIQLPDGTSYVFTYESTPTTPAPTYPNQIFSGAVTGRLASVTLPTGGTITYKYSGNNNGITCADGTTATLERYTPDTGSGYWTYAHLESGAAWTTTITDAQGNQTVLNFQGIYETQRRVYQGSATGTPLLNVVTCYNNNPNPCTNASNSTAITLPITQRTVLTSLNGGTSSQTTETYDGTYTLRLETDEYDFGGSSPIRKTIVSYNYNTSCGVTNSNVVNRACSILVKDGSGNVKAETDNTYDGNGNLLTESHKNTGGSPSSISRSFTYSSSGVLQTAKDFNGNQTTYTNSGCTNSFPTTIALPMSLSLSLTYDTGCYGAVVKSVTDANNQTTSYQYTDPNKTWRPTEADYPNCIQGVCGQSLLSYNDSANSFSITGKALLSSGTYHQTTQTLDGLGRVIHSQDSSAGSTVDTTYNNLGQVYSVSNPHGSSGAPSDGTTTYAYDAIGRVTGMTYPDNNTASISYSGACATSADAQWKVRKVCFDGLGRTTSVTEDPSGLNYSTTYTYDVLNNLTGVTQGSQARAYGYDMLSRLTSAATPESGTTHFTYDANGNVLTRTDARGVVTCSGTWSGSSCDGLGYDALNRLTKKTYSDGTPTANYYYDETSVSFGGSSYGASQGVTNTVGRLSHTTTGSNSTATIHGYDAVGRTTSLWECMPAKCSNNSLFSTSYSYDLAGDLLTSTRPYYGATENADTFNYSYNAAQQVTGITSTYSDSIHPPTVAQNMTYTPFGALSTMANGCVGTNCVPAQESYTYDNRLQPVVIQVGQYQGNLSAFSCTVYNYYSGVSNATSCSTPSPASSGNNGNVMGYYYADGFQSSFSHTATYGYDGVNRLASAAATGANTYSLGYGYDRWGNMDCTGGAGGGSAVGPCPAWTYNTSTNQINTSGFNYDAAGNLMNDGSGTGTHSYQWDAEGHLASVDVGGSAVCGNGATVCYTYNALGQRVQGVYSGSAYPGTFEWLFDSNGEELSECDGGYDSGGRCWYSSWVRLGGRSIADYWPTNLTAFNHPDNLGSSTMTTVWDGTVATDMRYYPFGQIWQNAGRGMWDVHFAGMQYPETNFGPWLMPTDFRKYHPTLGRWLSPDPLAGDITNPQSLNRYAYVLNNPCSMVDPLGLGSCNLNVQFINDAGLTGAQVQAAEGQVNAILGAVQSPSGDSVGISWVSGGQSDATLTATNQSAISSLLYGPQMGIYSWWPPLSPRVWVNNLPAQADNSQIALGRLIGAAGVHELAHNWFGREQSYDPNNLNTLMFDNLPPDTQTSALLNPNSVVWRLTSSQVSSLFQQCQNKHGTGKGGGGGHGPLKNTPPDTGGGGGGGILGQGQGGGPAPCTWANPC